MDGTHFLHIKRGGLLFLVTTKVRSGAEWRAAQGAHTHAPPPWPPQFNVSPAFTLELLDRTTKVFKDYCGVLTEESIRKNFILVYELLDEMVDDGHVQGTSSDLLKSHVHNEPVAVAAAASKGAGLRFGASKTVSASAVQRPISIMATSKGKKNEIFVDVLERLTVLFNSSGYMINSSIDGCIQMKSYLSGNPPLRLALNEDLQVGKDTAGGYGTGVVLDDCNFHECVDVSEFDSDRCLSLKPPDGEFVVMNYRMTSDFRAPFRVTPIVEEVSATKLELVLKVRADIPSRNYGANVTVRFPTPRAATSVKPVLAPATGTKTSSTAVAAAAAGSGGGGAAGGQVAEYLAKEKEVAWQIKKLQGGTEATLRTKISLPHGSGGSARKELGPITLSFEVPMYNVSNVNVRYLRIAEASKSYKPQRWVRYVTQSSSYVSRL